MRQIILIMLMFVLTTCTSGLKKTNSTSDSLDKVILKKLFIDWKKNEIAQGRIWAEDSCNMDWFSKHDYNEPTIPWGFPDTSEYKYSYADLNNDGKIDQLVTFIPSQCDGGNGSMWTQIEVLIISDKGKYKIISSLGDGLFSSLGIDTTGFYWYDSIGVNKIYGTFIKFMKDDEHCCPSIVKPVIFAYDTKKIIYIGDNIERK
jgi:hypothetical protein